MNNRYFSHQLDVAHIATRKIKEATGQKYSYGPATALMCKFLFALAKYLANIIWLEVHDMVLESSLILEKLC